jgi:hypothetical protein
VAKEIVAHPDVDLIYSDEDKLDEAGKRYEPYFKSDWNPALMLSQNAFCHLGVFRKKLIETVGGFRAGFEGSQDHDWSCAARWRHRRGEYVISREFFTIGVPSGPRPPPSPA